MPDVLETAAPVLEEAVEQAAEQVDLTPLLELLAQTNEYLHLSLLAVLVLIGVVLGCTISVILAVMFK